MNAKKKIYIYIHQTKQLHISRMFSSCYFIQLNAILIFIGNIAELSAELLQILK